MISKTVLDAPLDEVVAFLVVVHPADNNRDTTESGAAALARARRVLVACVHPQASQFEELHPGATLCVSPCGDGSQTPDARGRATIQVSLRTLLESRSGVTLTWSASGGGSGASPRLVLDGVEAGDEAP